MRRVHVVLALVLALVAHVVIAAPSGAASPYLLPVPAGTTVLTYQGNSSAFDHVATNGSQYAWDFTVGTSEFPVVASRVGTVIGARSDSTNTTCRDLSCWKDANYVLIDHGDGTSALYLHLATGSVAVKVGQAVAQGTTLGRADSTGYSYGTHLHFMVETTPDNRAAAGWWWTQSISITFGDAGLPLEGKSYLSRNAAGGASTPPPTRTPTPPVVLGGTWVNPKAGATVTTLKFTVSAKPTASLSDVQITKVVYTVAWDSKAPTTACTATKAAIGGSWSCTADLGVVAAPLGALTLSFDVFDDAGDVTHAPDGTRTVIFAAPPPAPTNAKFVDLLNDWVHYGAMDCVSKFAQHGQCGKIRVAWKWSGPSAGVDIQIYFADAGILECFFGPCKLPSPQQQCNPAPKNQVMVAEVNAAIGRLDVLVPPPFGLTCIWVVAKNGAGTSPRVFASNVTPSEGPPP